MTINLTSPDIRELKPRITVFGVGGAGGNAVNNMITAGLIGCDFVVPTPSFYIGDKPPCFAVFLANAWPRDAKITVSRAALITAM